MSYNKDTDYQSKINEAVEQGDYKSAAVYEQSRNDKIEKEGLDMPKTNRYSGWLDPNDYSVEIRKQISSGAPKADVAENLKKRVKKASGTDGLSQYAYDSVYDEAVKYIMGGNSFSYKEKVPTYKNSYKNDINRLMKELRSIKAFNYSPYDDELYEYYKKQYNREGRRAMEDMLGELSSHTGGVASSYAVTAASQSLDEYNRKLTDKIPELYEAAFDRYLKELGIKGQQLEQIGNLEKNEYSEYIDSLNQYNADRKFDYNAFLDEIKNDYNNREEIRKNLQSEREYELELKKLGNEEKQNASKAEQEKIENAIMKWKQSGVLDQESAEILGLPVGLHTTDYDYKKAQQHKLYSK